MQVLNLKREFEMQKMKKSETIKEYVAKLMSIVNQIRLFGENFPNERVIDKILVTVSEIYESKISSLEESKDLSKISLTELVNSLSAVDQRRSMMMEEHEKSEGAFLAKKYFGNGKGKACTHCGKLGHIEEFCWHKGKFKCYKCKKHGHLAKNCRSSEDEPDMAQVAEEETLF